MCQAQRRAGRSGQGMGRARSEYWRAAVPDQMRGDKGVCEGAGCGVLTVPAAVP